MIRKSLGNVHWLEFELLASFCKLKHAVFLRHGGHSQGAFNSLNLSTRMGDHPHDVASNLRVVKSTLGVSHLAFAEQIHSDGIAQVNSKNDHKFDGVDALLTQQTNVALKAAHADCQAAIFYDPVHHSVAAVHCGWRGNVCDIYKKALLAMHKAYGSKPADIHVAIGPSLGPQHAEFIHYKTEFPECFWQFRISEYHFNLWELARWQLTEAGILPSHLQIAEICTYASEEDCFSFRRGKRVTGAHGTVAMLRDK